MEVLGYQARGRPWSWEEADFVEERRDIFGVGRFVCEVGGWIGRV